MLKSPQPQICVERSDKKEEKKNKLKTIKEDKKCEVKSYRSPFELANREVALRLANT